MIHPSRDPRVPLAAERTLLAWIRTGVAMMGFGFVVARFGLFLREIEMVRVTAAHTSPPRMGVSLWIGTALVALGVLVTLLATWQHVRFIRSYNAGDGYPLPSFPLGVVVAVALSAIGLGMAIYLLVLAH